MIYQTIFYIRESQELDAEKASYVIHVLTNMDLFCALYFIES